MTKNSLKAAGKLAVQNNPWADKPNAKPVVVRVKCIRAEGFFGPDGFVGLGGEADVSEKHAKELIECGYVSVVANPAPETPIATNTGEPSNPAA